MTVEEQVLKSTIAIMRSPSWRFLSGILKTGDLKPKEGIPTAATDGIHIWYNVDFFSKLTPKEITFVLIHETLHKAYRHMTVWKHLSKQHPMVANMAMDYVINLEIITEERLSNTTIATMPKSGLLNTDYAGMDTLTIYKLLLEDPDLKAKSDAYNKAMQAGSDTGTGTESPQCGTGGVGEGFDEHIFADADSHTEEQLKELDGAIRQSAGQLPADRARELLNAGAVKRCWKDLLVSQWTNNVPGKDDASWSKINPVYLSMDIYLPGSVMLSAKKVNFCIDTSGSIPDEIIALAVSEVSNLATNYPPESLDVIWWDTEAHVQPIKQEEYNTLQESLTPMGGGGTDPTCLDTYMHDDVFTIVLTDGYFNAYTPPHNTIFLVIPEGITSNIATGNIIEM